MRLLQTTYKDADGNRKVAAKWYVEWRDHTGKVRRLPAFPDKTQSRRLGERLEQFTTSRVTGVSVQPSSTSGTNNGQAFEWTRASGLRARIPF